MVLGGAKPSDKLAVIANLLDSADRILIGGGMSYTFLTAQGYEVGKSLLEADKVDAGPEVLADAAERGVEIVLPGRPGRRDRLRPGRRARGLRRSTAFPADRESLDMGPATRELFAAKLADASHGVLERPGRRVRVPRVRGGHPGRGRGDQPRCPG